MRLRQDQVDSGFSWKILAVVVQPVAIAGSSSIVAILMFRLLFSLVFLWSSWGAQASEQPKTFGALEAWTFDASARQLSLRGWVLAGKDGKTPPIFKLSFMGNEFQSQDLVWTPREGITADSPFTGGQVGVGFDWVVSLSGDVPAGVHPISVDVAYPNGQHAALRSVQGEPSEIVVKKIRKSHWWALGIVLAVALFIRFGRVESTALAYKLGSWIEGRGAYLVIGGIFGGLVAFGITGSSVGLLVSGSPVGHSFVNFEGSQAKLFDQRPIRGDEWGVLMPNVLAQVNHEPKFPVVNENIGLSGQNMGVIGMTGAPVLQWAALAKPATWGYFFLPLRQAMSWQWQLPFWGGAVGRLVAAQCVSVGQTWAQFGLVIRFLRCSLCSSLVQLALVRDAVSRFGLCAGMQAGTDLSSLAWLAAGARARMAVGVLVPRAISYLAHHRWQLVVFRGCGLVCRSP